MQQYRAPAAAGTIGDSLLHTLPREGRTVEPRGWVKPVWVGGEIYLVSLRASVGDAVQIYSWRYHRNAGHVEAVDDRTRRVSG